jgi:hypothetical protein
MYPGVSAVAGRRVRSPVYIDEVRGVLLFGGMTVTDFPLPQPKRKRLPNRRMAVSETIEFVRSDGGLASYEATIGFDDQGRPKEIFLFGAKAGSDMALALADTAVALSVALQHGVTAQAMALSVSRNSGRRAGVGHRRGSRPSRPSRKRAGGRMIPQLRDLTLPGCRPARPLKGAL